jgi:hypothetical protein
VPDKLTLTYLLCHGSTHAQIQIMVGCCSYNCALAQRSVPNDCHLEFR